MKTSINQRVTVPRLTTMFRHRTRSVTIGLSMIAGLAVSLMSTDNLQAKTLDHPAIICALDEATEAMRCELKAHFRRVPGYGRMLAANSQLRARVAAIGRRVKRDPCYRNLSRDLARAEEYSQRLGELVQDVLNCPDSLRRAEGDLRGLTAQTNRLLNLTANLRWQLSH